MKTYDLTLDTVRGVAVINHIIARTDQDLDANSVVAR